jgi:hypothetical protein
MGQEAIIGILTLPSTIWEAFTQEKEMEAYAAMQNELAKVMRQMILDRRAFDDLMTRMRKLGLHDEDAKFFLDCMCPQLWRQPWRTLQPLVQGRIRAWSLPVQRPVDDLEDATAGGGQESRIRMLQLGDQDALRPGAGHL